MKGDDAEPTTTQPLDPSNDDNTTHHERTEDSGEAQPPDTLLDDKENRVVVKFGLGKGDGGSTTNEESETHPTAHPTTSHHYNLRQRENERLARKKWSEEVIGTNMNIFGRILTNRTSCPPELEHVVLTQVSMAKGLKLYGEAGVDAVEGEMQ